jgi:hypothetical protein
VRQFETGASKSSDDGKHDYEAFFGVRWLRSFGRYMHAHRFQEDGTVRPGDNWQQGLPRDELMKSAWRHFFDWWSLHRGIPVNDFAGKPVTIEEAVNAITFNSMAYQESLQKETDTRDSLKKELA